MSTKKRIELSASIKSQIEDLAQFISDETLKADKASDTSNWEIFYRYNEVFNQVAIAIGYDPTSEGNEDWTAIPLINNQIEALPGYKGKSADWLRKARRTLKVACEIQGKSVVDAGLEEISLRHLPFENCKAIANCSLPIAEKKELWDWLEKDSPKCKDIKRAIRERVQAHKYLKGSKDSPKVKGQPSAWGLDDNALEALAGKILSKVESKEIDEPKRLLKEIARQLNRYALESEHLPEIEEVLS